MKQTMLEGLICGLLSDQKFGVLKLDKFDSRSLTIRHFKDPCDITVDISCRFLVMLAHARIVENLPTFIVLSERGAL